MILELLFKIQFHFKHTLGRLLNKKCWGPKDFRSEERVCVKRALMDLKLFGSKDNLKVIGLIQVTALKQCQLQKRQQLELSDNFKREITYADNEDD